jgi:hypothetical protein
VKGVSIGRVVLIVTFWSIVGAAVGAGRPDLVQIDPEHLRYSRHEGIWAEHTERGEQCSPHRTFEGSEAQVGLDGLV